MDLNAAFVSGGVVVDVADDAPSGTVIDLALLSDLNEPASIATRHVIDVGKGANVTLVESHLGQGSAARQTNHVTDLLVGDDAEVTHLKLLAEGEASTHLGTWNVRLGARSRYKAFQQSEQPLLARNQLFLNFAGEGSVFGFNGVFLGRGKSHIDTTLVIDHAVPHCTSRELVKGVLDDEARGVFQGKVIVRPDAQKSDGKQMAKALLLSETAEFDSKPELEIYADDVICGHGSTAAEIDPSQMFYLQARGIPANQARSILTEAFLGEAVDSIENELLRETIRARIVTWLAKKAAHQ
jgi:Fe-S cluster assembly protein SufD